MNRKIKFVISGTAIIAAMAFLFYIGLGQKGSFAYYLTVSEYMEKGAIKGENFRINGIVLDGSIRRDSLGKEVIFKMTDREDGPADSGHILTVSYRGSVPDTFIDGADVVIEGKMSSEGTFDAHTLLAKCPSKYESASE